MTQLFIRYKQFSKTEIRDVKIFLGFVLLYMLWTGLVVGFRNDHLNFSVFIGLCVLLTPFTRQIAYSFCFFILFWILYDSMRVYPNYLINEVHIEDLYLLEKKFFGVFENNVLLTPNEYFANHTSQFLDFISGVFYLTWVPVPLALGLYFFFKDKVLLLQFSAAFLFTNLLGFCVYYLYPAAPPWYFEMYGSEEIFNIQGNPAQLASFDKLIGYPLFSGIYTKNANVFAAVPSLHAAYPVVALFYAVKSRLKWPSVLIFLDMIGIWFAAVYSYHHYVIDVLLGVLCAIVALIIFEKHLMKTKLRIWIEKYASFIQLQNTHKE
ncbi:MAG: inositol phosphorylceramide synthase [Saprospiraceae bacterium]|nr:inositol phosphorylceramide synthase [Saprospiraceae bacterium]